MISVHRRHDSKDNTWAAPTHGRPTSRCVGKARAKYICKRATCARDGQSRKHEVLLLIRSSSSERVVDDLADNKSSR